MANPLVSFIIVNMNTRALLVGCLESIKKTVSLDHEIWVVDNGSTDDSVSEARRLFPDVVVIENKQNLGFARANNIALKRAKGEYAVLINTDAVLKGGAVETLISFLDRTPKAACVGPQLLNADGSRQNSIANFPTLATELLSKSLLRRLDPRRYPGKEQRYECPIEVESIVGACMAIRLSATKDAGLLDERYFFFLEETDWCLSFWKKGWKVYHNPGAEVFHLQGGSAKEARIEARIEYWRSRYSFFRKNRGASSLALLYAGLSSKLVVKLAFSLLANAMTLFTIKKLRSKLRLYSRLFTWHVAGCPASWGLEPPGLRA